MINPNRRGDTRDCGRATYMMVRHKKAVTVRTSTKVIRLERNSFSKGGIAEEQLLLHLNGGVPGESAGMQPA